MRISLAHASRAAGLAVALAVVATAGVTASHGVVGTRATTRWTLQALPSPRGAARALLHDLSCVTPRWCLAVGYSADPMGLEYALAEERLGATWRIVPTPNRPTSSSSVLAGVACVSARRCVAVGSWTGRSGLSLPLVESWDGARWSISAPPTPPGATSGALDAVACPAPSRCVAAGWYFEHHGVQKTLVYRWDGRSWTQAATPSVPGAEGTRLSSISCPSPRACVTVGAAVSATGVTTTVAEVLRDGTWRIVATPRPPVAASTPWAELVSVSCARPSSCLATGDYGRGAAAPYVGLAESYDGAAWRLRPPARPPGSSKSPLTGVSCRSPTWCTAVGFSTSRAGTVTLAEVWDGTRWRIAVTPNVAATTESVLYDVACRSIAACTASGYAGIGGHDVPLAETTTP